MHEIIGELLRHSLKSNMWQTSQVKRPVPVFISRPRVIH